MDGMDGGMDYGMEEGYDGMGPGDMMDDYDEEGSPQGVRFIFQI